MDFTGTAQRAMGIWGESGRPGWLDQLVSRTLPRVALLVLVVLVAYVLAQITWQVIPVPAEQHIVRSGEVLTETKHPGRSIKDQSDRLSALHVFGRPGVVKRSAPKVVAERAPETNLNLTLHGVFADPKPELGAAIIGKAGSEQKYYKVGKKIMGGVTLQAVHEDRVVLLRNGQSEVLRFPRASNKPVVTSSRSKSASKASSSSSLSTYKEMFKREPLKIFQHLRFVPVRTGKQLKGYRILPQKNRDLYNRLGVRPSDLVTSVNGVPLNDDKQAMGLIKDLQSADSIELVVLRQGQQTMLSLDLN
ncbi:MAG: type II secretion system protein GspC [endosymbiont of Seepiophila jonesi]|uniref:Type II secretion system protein GspC n=1 Tax=endosymbiont of Lamellibrachia luymesi TaxID=2200907 RepID=A0A370DYS6_9GAMM|nr:MAG: type II secretion system protein GspC [endosymbiont of Seepiophila jonesi]RDH90280.1 MAG: type II secretion system protein GspC [endosymbiont of Lamellibrachia luymesi]